MTLRSKSMRLILGMEASEVPAEVEATGTAAPGAGARARAGAGVGAGAGARAEVWAGTVAVADGAWVSSKTSKLFQFGRKVLNAVGEERSTTTQICAAPLTAKRTRSTAPRWTAFTLAKPAANLPTPESFIRTRSGLYRFPARPVMGPE